MSIASQLRAAIKSSGESLAKIGRETAVPQPVLTRFMKGGGISLTTAEKLVAYFGLEIIAPDSTPKRKK